MTELHDELAGIFRWRINAGKEDDLVTWAGSIEQAETILSALQEREAQAATIEKLQGIITILRSQLEIDAETFEWLLINEPDCLGWTGHDPQDGGGAWPVVKEHAFHSRQALKEISDGRDRTAA